MQDLGNCWLRQPEIARIVEDAVLHFDGERYRLIAWAVMPNHVHALIEPIAGHGLGSIVSSWKRSRREWQIASCGIQGRSGKTTIGTPYIRNEWHFESTISYNREQSGEGWAVKQAADWPLGPTRG